MEEASNGPDAPSVRRIEPRSGETSRESGTSAAERLLRLLGVATGPDRASTGSPGERPADWKYLIHLTERHKVVPLLHKQLQSPLGDGIPPWVLAHLRHRSEAIATRNLGITVDLVRVMALFESEGVRAIAFKGPTLALALYNSLALRQEAGRDAPVCVLSR